MNRGFREMTVRALRLLAVSGLLAAAAPGCGGASDQEDGEAAIPESVQESNQEMENFMKSQQTTKP